MVAYMNLVNYLESWICFIVRNRLIANQAVWLVSVHSGSYYYASLNIYIQRFIFSLTITLCSCLFYLLHQFCLIYRHLILLLLYTLKTMLFRSCNVFSDFTIFPYSLVLILHVTDLHIVTTHRSVLMVMIKFPLLAICTKIPAFALCVSNWSGLNLVVLKTLEAPEAAYPSVIPYSIWVWNVMSKE